MQPTKKRKAQGQPKQKAPKRQRVPHASALGALGSAPVAYGAVRPPVTMRSMVPTRKGGEIRIVGCDFIQSLSTSATAYSIVAYQIAPLGTGGTTSAFPRLSAISEVFGKYAFNKLRYYVVGKAPSTLGGDMTSVIVFEGGSNAALASLTEAQLKNRYGQVTSKFWENHVMEVDCGKATVPWFVNADDEAVASDTNTFGYYLLGLEATPSAATAVADIFVEYDVEFCEAKSVSDLA